jgi:two-component system, OmpR family, response regulator ChvI
MKPIDWKSVDANPICMSTRVLLVDDESDINASFREVLEQNRFNDHSFESPLLALESFKPHFYDLAILDIKLPQINGFLFYRQIKTLDKNLKICFLSAGEMYSGVYSDIFSSLPVSYFMRKPINNADLITRINQIINDISIQIRSN